MFTSCKGTPIDGEGLNRDRVAQRALHKAFAPEISSPLAKPDAMTFGGDP
jgi:hypothetical protein